MSINIYEFTNTKLLTEEASKNFIIYIENILKNKNNFNVALLGGNTAKLFFEVLRSYKPSKKIIRKINFFFSDERPVPIKSLRSNAGNAYRLLLKPWGIKKENFFPIKEALNYEKIIYKKLRVNNKNNLQNLRYLLYY